MDRKELFEFYQKLYWYDIDAREHLNNRLQIPLGIVVALAGLLGFLLQNYEHKTLNWTTGSFIGFLAIASVGLVITTTLLVLSGYRHAYNFIPEASVLESHRISLENYYTAYPGLGISAADAFNDYLLKHYVDYSSTNTGINDKRSRRLHQTNTAIIGTAVVLVAAFLVFYFGRLDKNHEDKTVKVLITSPVIMKGAPMSQSQQMPPPPPPPPPARVVRDDGGRHKTPPPPPTERK